MSPVSLDSFGARLGGHTALDDVPGLPEDVRAVFRSDGVTGVRVAPDGPVELATSALAGTLNGCDRPDDVRSLVWASTSFHTRSWYTDDVSHAVSALGLPHVQVVGVTLAECSNFGPALAVARDLATADRGPVALVCTDVARGPDERLVAPGAALLSDGAASCLVRPGGGRFVLEGMATVSNHRLRGLDPVTQSVRASRITAQGASEAARRALAAAGRGPDEVDVLLVPHHQSAARALFVHCTGVDPAKARTPVPDEPTHVFAADVLLELPAIACEPDDVVLATVAGRCTWTSLVLRADRPAGGPAPETRR